MVNEMLAQKETSTSASSPNESHDVTVDYCDDGCRNCKRSREGVLEACRRPRTNNVKMQTNVLVTKSMLVQTDKEPTLAKLGFGGQVVVTTLDKEVARKAIKGLKSLPTSLK